MELGDFPELEGLIRDKLTDPELDIQDTDYGSLGDEDYKKLTKSVVPLVLELSYLAFQAGKNFESFEERRSVKEAGKVPDFEEWLKLYLKHI